MAYPQKFFPSISFSVAASIICSASIFFSLAFSASSVFSRRASDMRPATHAAYLWLDLKFRDPVAKHRAQEPAHDGRRQFEHLLFAKPNVLSTAHNSGLFRKLLQNNGRLVTVLKILRILWFRCEISA